MEPPRSNLRKQDRRIQNLPPFAPLIAKENFMRKIVLATLAATFLLPACGVFGAPASSKPSPGSIVIVFKDGHRQSFNLSDIERVEFPTAASAASAGANPSRGHYFGKWEVGDGNGGNFFITLSEDGDAYRTLNAVHGKWVYVNGEAHITWNDGAQDAIRRVGSRYQKSAYRAGKTFNDEPDNVTDAKNTEPKPI
jgi:hypothetical protein